jgi:hypothetical protein
MNESVIKIRFNHDCKDAKNYWRAIINGMEYHCSEIIINTNCKTTKDWLEDKNEYKWHITVVTKNYVLHNGILTIN